ncbi:MAG TPA: M14 family zinc carboxypeptidase [Thermoanaerobaculia bacterium]
MPIEEILAAPPFPPPGRVLGHSRRGQEIDGYRFGRGDLHVSLIAGCHADEPVGPAMLRRLVSLLAARPADDPLLAAATWSIVPHVNPDGEALNAGWTPETLPALDPLGREDRVYDLSLYANHAVRELPGDDMEFGFPRDANDSGARPENRAVAAFLAEGAPFHLHASFHGMGFATGPWFLIEEAWIDRTAELRDSLRRQVRAMGYQLFDVDRGGEKGFHRVDEGFTTRPDSRSMVRWFEERGDPEIAARFRPSSMEYVRSLGGDPFIMVSEMPLFLRPLEEGETGRPDDPHFRAFLSRIAGKPPEEVRAEMEKSGVRGMPIRDQMRLQIAFLNAALAMVGEAGA